MLVLRRIALVAAVCLAAARFAAAQEPDYRALAERALASSADAVTRFRLQLVELLDGSRVDVPVRC